MKSGSLPSKKGTESGREGGAACAVSVLEAKGGLSDLSRCWNCQPPGPPREAQSLLGPTPSTLPLPERSLYFEGSSVAWSFSFPLFSPNSLPCPGLRIPDSSQGPTVPRPPLRSGSARPKLPSRHPQGRCPLKVHLADPLCCPDPQTEWATSWSARCLLGQTG